MLIFFGNYRKNPLSVYKKLLYKKNYKVYDWIENNGRDNLRYWIEKTAKQVIF
ncbi:hypothetical protein BAZOLSSOX_2960 [uncultured Gammaproteobacteria bacterium]|uniref:Uncharacterized protein n=1 Tax=Bathymodiolus azoricus thioautotrophic gill symbiont TaxID=235205 RepID=A0A1H6KTY9_9GAMM|nr:hypothetical protein [uncultured Gammaproteobacteria bacterium]CAC9992763.1 hypothetical protein [uncultured Gammaproteobacteria bacterium]SEH79339.1 hypothetical protein BAZSYMA_ACONTIG00191_1 [Bathymodiolus azoricus thioautotrophic gill symbiont]VVH59014.1 hypothetical protein BAZOLSSOX_2960 [uncultured Gammaproteobacteria bacterium]